MHSTMRSFVLIALLVAGGSARAADEQPAAPAEAPTAEGHAQTGRYGKQGGILPDLHFGPKIQTVSFPTVARGGLEVKWLNLLGVSFEMGWFPALSLSGNTISMSSWRASAKLYPYKKAFHIGVGIGQQTFTGSRTEEIATFSSVLSLEIKSTTLTPFIGWRWVAKSGFFFGMEFGVQLTPSSAATFTTTPDNPLITSDPEYATLKTQIEDQGRLLAQTPLPAVTFVEMGFLF